jgi:probable phosphoglycerate mutase
MSVIQQSTLLSIAAEIARQDELKAAGKFVRTCAELSDGDNLLIVLEELSEVAEDMAAGQRGHARQELLETITCLVRWYEREDDDCKTYFRNADAIRDELITLGAKARAAQSPPEPKPTVADKPEAVVFADGGSRGNPGLAAGAAILIRDGQIVKRGTVLPSAATSNAAEYTGLCEALDLAFEHNVERLEVRMDSQLVIRQMQGAYRVKHPDMQRLHAIAKVKAARFASIAFTHIPRERNALADAHVNELLDGAMAS